MTNYYKDTVTVYPNPPPGVVHELRTTQERQPSNPITDSSIYGPTELVTLGIDVVNSVGIDAMHCIYEGVVSHILELWFESTGRPWSIPKTVIEEMDKELAQIRLSKHYTRSVRSYAKHGKYWKGMYL